jgi:hypothetical protein
MKKDLPSKKLVKIDPNICSSGDAPLVTKTLKVTIADSEGV